MGTMRWLPFLALLLILTGCAAKRAADKAVTVIEEAKITIIDSDGKTKPVSELKKERDAAVQDRIVLDVKIGVLDKAIKEAEQQQQRRWLIAITVISFLGSLICLGIMLAWPNPALVTLERIGVFTFGCIGGGAWFASMLLPYLSWIFGGVCVLIAFFIVRYMVTGKKLGRAAEVAGNLFDEAEQKVIAPLLAQVNPENNRMIERLGDLKNAAKAEQLAGGFWHQTEALRLHYDDTHAAAKPTPLPIRKP